ncbi:MAG: UDP-glucose 4-epimerase GalE [Bacteroidota bacterium]
MAKILVTGGAGYIGSHTAIEILEAGKYGVVSIDNLLNASDDSFPRIKQITGKEVVNYAYDLVDYEKVRSVFEENSDIIGVIHFAALKSVGDSVEMPLQYYQNNFNSMINILRCCEEFEVANFIFSSSCSVYGNVEKLPVDESTPVSDPESPYANTKLVGERIIRDFMKATDVVQAISLRYFNPVGAHASGLIGENPRNKPNNLVPIITAVASGLMPKLTVFGDDYETRDGTCIRDYIHVSDIADAHVKALDYLIENRNTEKYELFNLGSGNGVTVLEAINAFEKVSGVSLNYILGERRPGDVVSIYSDSSLAKDKLGWVPSRDIEEMMSSAWKWQEAINSEKVSS